ncbi:MAG: glycosyltransferase family 61 protein [Caulobacteraceae bacterium]|nr:glycosyltransferase family 61 protein [Caulobacteraceae bacterium]
MWASLRAFLTRRAEAKPPRPSPGGQAPLRVSQVTPDDKIPRRVLKVRKLRTPSAISIPPLTMFGPHELAPQYERPAPMRYVARIDDGLVWGRTFLPFKVASKESAIYFRQGAEADLYFKNHHLPEFEFGPEHVYFTPRRSFSPTRSVSQGVLAATRYGFNYFHWMIAEGLPRILLADAAGYAGYPLIVGEMPRQHLEIVELLWPKRKIEPVAAHELVRVGRLVIAHPATYSPNDGDPYNAVYDPDSVDALRARLAPICAPYWSERSAPLLVSRSRVAGPTGERRAVNGAELEGYLSARYGCRVIHPQEMSLEEQIEAFASASLVICPSGAAVSNLIFCRKGAPTILFGQDRSVYPEYFGILAGRLEIPLAYLPSPPRDGGFPPYHVPYEVDLDRLEEAMAWAGATPQGKAIALSPAAAG